MSLALRSLALAAVAVAAIPGAAVARVPQDFVGLTSEDAFARDDIYREDSLRAQANAGVGLLRQTFNWSEIETSPGSYNLARYDELVASAAAHGIEILPILFHTPSFHARRSSNGRSTCPPRPDAMARFAQELVRRYGPGGTLWSERPGVPRLPIRSWQIWNEPSLAPYWCGRPRPRAYVRLLRVVGGAIERVDPRAEIVTGGLPPSKLRHAVPLRRYLARMYRARAARWFDTLAINSYARGPVQLVRLLRSVRRLMDRRRDRRTRIWVTELGWADDGPRHRFVVGERGQARRVGLSLAAIRRHRRRLRLRGVVYFSWRDAAPYAPEFEDLWGLHTGLLTIAGRPKPAFYAFRRGVRRLRGVGARGRGLRPRSGPRTRRRRARGRRRGGARPGPGRRGGRRHGGRRSR